MTWLTVKEAATLLNVTESAIKKASKTTKYKTCYVDGVGQGGKQLRIALESLPVEVQNKYKGCILEMPKGNFLDFTAKQREKVDPFLRAIAEYEQAAECGYTADEFLDDWNRANDFQISRSTFFYKKKQLQENGDPTDLIDTRGGYNSVKTPIPDNHWEYFYSLYMTENRRGVQLCYDHTKKKFGETHHISTYRKKVAEIPEYAILQYRFGKTALKDALPSMQRDYTDICSNDVWFSDHHKMDFFVRDLQNKPVRPWLTVWTDARSRDVMSWAIRTIAPNANIVKKTLTNGMKERGVPFEVYIDNGEDYKAKENFDLDYPYSIASQLGINAIFATKYHGQAKTVERFFRTVEERFGKLFNTYAGKDAKNRPERLKDIPIEEYPTEEQAVLAFGNWLEDDYRHRSHRGDGMQGKAPNQVYLENLQIKRKADPQVLDLMAGRIEQRVISKHGVQIFNNTYWNDIFVHHKGKTVMVVYDPENIEQINIFDEEMKAICTAEPKVTTPFRNTTAEDYRAAQKRKKAVRKMTKEAAPIREMSLWQMMAQTQAIEKATKEQFALSESKPQEIDILTRQQKENIEILEPKNKEGQASCPEADMLKVLQNKA